MNIVAIRKNTDTILESQNYTTLNIEQVKSVIRQNLTNAGLGENDYYFLEMTNAELEDFTAQ